MEDEVKFGSDMSSEDKPKDVTERIKTFEDAVHELGDDNMLVKEYNDYNAHNATGENNIDIVAYIKLRIVVAALNEGWRPQFKEVEESGSRGSIFTQKINLKEKQMNGKTALLYSFSACAATHRATACIAGTLIRTRSAIGLFRSLTSRRGLPSNQKTLQFTAGGSSQHCGRNITLVRYASRGEK